MNSHQRRGSWRWWKRELLAGRNPRQEHTTGMPPFFKDRILAMSRADAMEFAIAILDLGKARGGDTMDECIDKLHWTERQALSVVTRTGNTHPGVVAGSAWCVYLSEAATRFFLVDPAHVQAPAGMAG